MTPLFWACLSYQSPKVFETESRNIWSTSSAVNILKGQFLSTPVEDLWKHFLYMTPEGGFDPRPIELSSLSGSVTAVGGHAQLALTTTAQSGYYIVIGPYHT